VRFTFSDGGVDRMGDTINPEGWDLRQYLTNPVVLWAHDSSQPPIGRAKNVRVEAWRLLGDIEFAGKDVYEFADQIFRLVKGGWLNAVSVGFTPRDYTFRKDPARQGGIDFHKQKFMEVSIVPVPALPTALVEERGMKDHQRELRRIRAQHITAGLKRPAAPMRSLIAGPGQRPPGGGRGGMGAVPPRAG
jgi:HK97 family phage prohead protease